MKDKINSKTLYICKTALLSAAAIVLSAVEMALPDFPFVFPGMKLGISNIATMLGIEILGFTGTFGIVIVKSVFVMLTRGFTAFLMSICGGILSFTMMYIAEKIKMPKFGSVGIGIIGAFFHNLGQLFAASFLVGNAVFGYGAILSFISVATGTLTGICIGIIFKYTPIDKLSNA